MKKGILGIALLALALHANSQALEIGARGGISSFWLFNSSAPGAGNSETKTLSLSYNGGLHLAFDITDNVGIETNLLYASLNQTYSGNFSKVSILADGSTHASGQTYTSKINLTAMQVPLLLCLETNSGSFVELGAQYDVIQGASYSGTFANPSYTNAYNAAGLFAKNEISGVFGVGGKYCINDYLFIISDVRVTYGFTDLKGIDGLGQAYNNSPYYTDIKPTNAVNASVNVGVFYLLSVSRSYRIGHKCKGTPRVRSGNHHS